MAIAYVNSTTGTASSSSSLSIPVPDEWVQDGQLLICIVGDSQAPVTYTEPSGWTTIFEVTSDPCHHIAYKIADSESGSWSWSKSKSCGSNWVVIGFSGVDKTNPIGVTDDTTYKTNDSTLRHHSITTTVANALVLAIGVVYYDMIPTTPPSGYTKRVDFQDTDDGSWAAFIISEKLYASTGATGDQDTVCSVTDPTKWGYHVELKPAAAAGGIPHFADLCGGLNNDLTGGI